jgi:redox-sensitive bicupin YhaK (pirin superfamily)
VISVRPVETIHHVEGGWFSANWHFSFDTYQDPEHTIFGDLRVFNDDRLLPGAVWPMHPHRDIEGITYVADGTFEHADSLGNGGVLAPGSVQRATLGSGMLHSERNHSRTRSLRFIQLWILPAKHGLPPSVEQRSFPASARQDTLLPVVVPAAGFGGDGAPHAAEAVRVHQDAAMFASLHGPGSRVEHRFRAGFGGYLFVVQGELCISGTDGTEARPVAAGGAATITDEAAVGLVGGPAGCELLLVETRLGTRVGA